MENTFKEGYITAIEDILKELKEYRTKDFDKWGILNEWIGIKCIENKIKTLNLKRLV